MSKQKHSPLPWKVGKFKDVILDANGYAFLELWAEDGMHAKDAKFIIEACNNYEHLQAENQRLREALNGIVKIYKSSPISRTFCECQEKMGDMYVAANMALRQEGGGE